MKTIMLLMCMCLLSVFLLTACTPFPGYSTADCSASQDPSYVSGEETAEYENEMFNRFYSNNGEQADQMFEQIISCVEAQDTAALKELFSASAIDTDENIDEEIADLLEFYEGEMTSHKRWGPGSHAEKEDGMYFKDIFSSYDVTTTAGIYRIAIRFCIIESQNSDNLGLTSLYIIKAEDSDMTYAYWGGDVWNYGINIEHENHPV